MSTYNEETVNVELTGRTLYKDGYWNTLCLPFSVVDGDDSDGLTFTGTPLEGAIVKTLGNSEACDTGFDASTGTLNLDFVDADEIEPGVPYIVKWAKPEGYDADPSDFDIVDPVFSGVTVENEDPADHTICSTDGNYYIKACRAYFHVDLGDATNVRAFVLNFGDDETTGIVELKHSRNEALKSDTGWYSLDGRKLSGKPAAKGVYIVNGRKKVIIK